MAELEEPTTAFDCVGPGVRSGRVNALGMCAPAGQPTETVLAQRVPQALDSGVNFESVGECPSSGSSQSHLTVWGRVCDPAG